jgi:CheY-like chemotaxis protein
MKILILEDDQERIKTFRRNLEIGCQTFLVAITAEACIQALENIKFDWLFLDHDLGGKVFVQSDGEEKTGWHGLSENEDRKPENIVIHSLNEAGRKRMMSLLPKAKELPFAWNLVKIENRKENQ